MLSSHSSEEAEGLPPWALVSSGVALGPLADLQAGHLVSTLSSLRLSASLAPPPSREAWSLRQGWGGPFPPTIPLKHFAWFPDGRCHMGRVPWGKMAQTCREGAGSGGWDCHHMAALGWLGGGCSVGGTMSGSFILACFQRDLMEAYQPAFRISSCLLWSWGGERGRQLSGHGGLWEQGAGV